MDESYPYKKKLEGLGLGVEIMVDRENLPIVKGRVEEVEEFGFTMKEVEEDPYWNKMIFIAFKDIRGIRYSAPN